MAVKTNPEPSANASRIPASWSAWFNEMFRENAMLDEATRFMRQFMRTGGDAGKGANLVMIGIMLLFYLWFLATMIRFDMSVSIPLEYAQLVMVTLVMPASIYAAISGEREKATWDALVLTRLTPAQIIVGKLAWRLAIALVIMGVLFIGIFISQFLGDTNSEFNDPPLWTAVFVGQVMIFSWAALLSAFGLWVSANTKQSVNTIAIVVGVLLGGLIGLPMLLSTFGTDTNLNQVNTFPELLGAILLWLHPFGFLYTLTGRPISDYESPPLSPLTWALLVTCIYLVVTALFVYLSYNRIRQLEEPVRTS